MTPDVPVLRPEICSACSGERILWDNYPGSQPKSCPECSAGQVLGPEWFEPKMTGNGAPPTPSPGDPK